MSHEVAKKPNQNNGQSFCIRLHKTFSIANLYMKSKFCSIQTWHGRENNTFISVSWISSKPASGTLAPNLAAKVNFLLCVNMRRGLVPSGAMSFPSSNKWLPGSGKNSAAVHVLGVAHTYNQCEDIFTTLENMLLDVTWPKWPKKDWSRSKQSLAPVSTSMQAFCGVLMGLMTFIVGTTETLGEDLIILVYLSWLLTWHVCMYIRWQAILLLWQ